jgi:hypothetical protein
MSAPPPRRIAPTIARSTTNAICAGPRPIARIRRSPTAIPTPTPSTISIARRVCLPGVTPSTITAAIGAKNGLLCPSRSCATYQASPAAIAVCRS